MRPSHLRPRGSWQQRTQGRGPSRTESSLFTITLYNTNCYPAPFREWSENNTRNCFPLVRTNHEEPEIIAVFILPGKTYDYNTAPV